MVYAMLRSARVECVWRRIADPRFGEATLAEVAGVAVTTRDAVGGGIVAAERERVVHAEREPELDDLTLAQIEQRRLDPHWRRALHAAACGEVRHRLVVADVLRPAIGIAGVVQRIHADEDVGGAEHLRPREAEGEEDR